MYYFKQRHHFSLYVCSTLCKSQLGEVYKRAAVRRADRVHVGVARVWCSTRLPLAHHGRRDSALLARRALAVPRRGFQTRVRPQVLPVRPAFRQQVRCRRGTC